MSETNSTKKCSKCTYKPLSEFSKCDRNKDGLQYICKACGLEYRNTEDAKLTSEKYRKSEAGKLSLTKGKAKYKSYNPVKRKAHNAVSNAVRDGRMEKPDNCSECPSTKRIHGHHDDYSLPLAVRWLCRICHTAWHKENGSGLNG